MNLIQVSERSDRHSDLKHRNSARISKYDYYLHRHRFLYCMNVANEGRFCSPTK